MRISQLMKELKKVYDKYGDTDIVIAVHDEGKHGVAQMDLTTLYREHGFSDPDGNVVSTDNGDLSVFYKTYKIANNNFDLDDIITVIDHNGSQVMHQEDEGEKGQPVEEDDTVEDAQKNDQDEVDEASSEEDTTLEEVESAPVSDEDIDTDDSDDEDVEEDASEDESSEDDSEDDNDLDDSEDPDDVDDSTDDESEDVNEDNNDDDSDDEPDDESYEDEDEEVEEKQQAPRAARGARGRGAAARNSRVRERVSRGSAASDDEERTPRGRGRRR